MFNSVCFRSTLNGRRDIMRKNAVFNLTFPYRRQHDNVVSFFKSGGNGFRTDLQCRCVLVLSLRQDVFFFNSQQKRQTHCTLNNVPLTKVDKPKTLLCDTQSNLSKISKTLFIKRNAIFSRLGNRPN